MAKIRHVASIVRNAEALKDFYEQAFGFEQCYGPSASNSYMVMDGTFNLALLQIRPSESQVVGTHRADGGEANQTPGINHFGFVVDSVEDSLKRLGAEGLKHGENPQDGRPAEMRVFDPWGNGFDLSARGYFGREEVRLPAVRHVQIQADDPGAVAEFYGKKLDLQPYGGHPDGSVCLSDGLISMTVMPKGPLPKKGIQSIGIQVDDWDALAERFKAMGRDLQVPQDRNAEVTIEDPEGNLIVLSQRGW